MVRRLIVLTVVVLCVTGLPAARSSAAGPEFSPGAAGMGDPYFPLDGNGGYDVQHYLLEVSYDPSTNLLTGMATIRADATQDLSQFNLDLDGLDVRSVHVDGAPAQWSRSGQELTVVPASGLPDGGRFHVVVRYDGRPQTISDQFGRSGFIHTDDGALVVGQPHVAATWFPVNDHPRDKATYVFRITVPEGLEAVANGRLKDRHTEGGHTTWTWGSRAMASYLATATIGEFELTSYRRDGIEFVDALDPDLLTPSATPIGQIAEGSLGRQKEVIDFLADHFGPYPFASAGGIVDDEPILFALENQTRPIYSFLFFFDPLEGDRVVAHELAHQWFGDHLSLDTWQHIWLNEGLATYAEWLWSEREGPATVQQIFDFAYAVIPPDAPFWSLPIGDPGPDRLFDKAVYDRGAMTVHQLRLAVGDAAFQRILHSWVEANAGGSVTTDAFIALAEDISGQDLDPLFETWLFTPGKPDLGAASGPELALQTPPALETSRAPSRR